MRLPISADSTYASLEGQTERQYGLKMRTLTLYLKIKSPDNIIISDDYITLIGKNGRGRDIFTGLSDPLYVKIAKNKDFVLSLDWYLEKPDWTKLFKSKTLHLHLNGEDYDLSALLEDLKSKEKDDGDEYDVYY